MTMAVLMGMVGWMGVSGSVAVYHSGTFCRIPFSQSCVVYAGRQGRQTPETGVVSKQQSAVHDSYRPSPPHGPQPRQLTDQGRELVLPRLRLLGQERRAEVGQRRLRGRHVQAGEVQPAPVLAPPELSDAHVQALAGRHEAALDGVCVLGRVHRLTPTPTPTAGLLSNSSPSSLPCPTAGVSSRRPRPPPRATARRACVCVQRVRAVRILKRVDARATGRGKAS